MDDGIGIRSLHQRGIGLGMSRMAYRAGLINARLTVDQADQDGTMVKCLVPNNTDSSLFDVLSNPRCIDECDQPNRCGDNERIDC